MIHYVSTSNVSLSRCVMISFHIIIVRVRLWRKRVAVNSSLFQKTETSFSKLILTHTLCQLTEQSSVSHDEGFFFQI